MPEIVQVSAAEVMRVLPELVPLEQGLVRGDGVDLLIMSLDLRTAQLRLWTISAGFGSKHVLTIDYPTNLKDNCQEERSWGNCL